MGEFQCMKIRVSFPSPRTVTCFVSLLWVLKHFGRGCLIVTTWVMDLLLWKPLDELPDSCGFLFNSRHVVAVICYFTVYFISCRRGRQ